jgi:hypothetical protein
MECNLTEKAKSQANVEGDDAASMAVRVLTIHPG